MIYETCRTNNDTSGYRWRSILVLLETETLVADTASRDPLYGGSVVPRRPGIFCGAVDVSALKRLSNE